jgi:hypothetical protein
LFQGFVPRFVKRYAELGETIAAATRAYVGEVRGGQFPDEKHSFGSGPRAEPPSPDEARYASGQSASGQSASGQRASGTKGSDPKAPE